MWAVWRNDDLIVDFEVVKVDGWYVLYWLGVYIILGWQVMPCNHGLNYNGVFGE